MYKKVNIAGLRLLSLKRLACKADHQQNLGTWISRGFLSFQGELFTATNYKNMGFMLLPPGNFDF